MTHADRQQKRQERILLLMERWTRDHHEGCAEGDDCLEPLGLLAWLGHRFGLRSSHRDLIAKALMSYETACPGCTHERN